ncbi:MAG: TonB family protein [Spongiibacteraceae bacterium]
MENTTRIKYLLQPRWLSLGASGSLIALLMAVLLYLQNQDLIKPDGYTVREVKLSALAPPPPPPPSVQKTTNNTAAKISITTSGSGAAIELGELHLSDELTLTDITPPPLVPFDNSQFLTDSLNLAWSDVFSLDDLDERPRLLTKLNIRYPKALSNRGIHTTEVQLEVLIDSNGQASLKRILHSSHTEINPLIADVIQRTRFTPPKKDGVAVRASFNWPLEFSDH